MFSRISITQIPANNKLLLVPPASSGTYMVEYLHGPAEKFLKCPNEPLLLSELSHSLQKQRTEDQKTSNDGCPFETRKKLLSKRYKCVIFIKIRKNVYLGDGNSFNKFLEGIVFNFNQLCIGQMNKNEPILKTFTYKSEYSSSYSVLISCTQRQILAIYYKCEYKCDSYTVRDFCMHQTSCTRWQLIECYRTSNQCKDSTLA